MTDRDQHRMLETIRGLLAKAESSEFAPEADVFTAKAQELMAAHSIEMAMIDDRSRRAVGAEPTSRRIRVDRPYTEPKVHILAAAAQANNCEVIWSRHDGVATIFGFDHDLTALELLYTSLLIQATRAMTSEGSQTDWSGRNRTRSFRRSFLMGYANRIGWRLREATSVFDGSSRGDVRLGAGTDPGRTSGTGRGRRAIRLPESRHDADIDLQHVGVVRRRGGRRHGRSRRSPANRLLTPHDLVAASKVTMMAEVEPTP